MSDRLLQFYHRLPVVLRHTVACMRGYYLRSWRYGHETPELVEAAIEREYWSCERWKQWQEERLLHVLHRAATQVPYYREQWSKRKRNGDRASWEYLENWPILDKEPLRRNPKAFVADDCDLRKMFHEQTSGTTGKPLDLWWSRKTVHEWYALFEARIRRWHGISRFDRWAILGGQLITPVGQQKPPFWVWNRPLNQLYMSSYHLSPTMIPYYLEALKSYHVEYIYGYTSALYALALEVLRQNRNDLKMKVIGTNAEPLFSFQRQAIEEAFQCAVRETYGMAEIVSTASECSAGSLHLWPDVGITEVLPNSSCPVDQTASDLICTGLLNVDMPLIRYNVGDRGTLSTSREGCSCQRSLPILISVEGRSEDLLYTMDGRRVGRLDPVFKDKLPVREVQIIQDKLGKLRVNYVPARGFSRKTERRITHKLQERMGQVQVEMVQVHKIPRAANGKFRAVICNLSLNERANVENGHYGRAL